ncbi:hypothetical protein PIB30_114627, partial [Stylosanthes scabra]|nr:hypothetical protein [Stylosanthes scabra]
GMVVSDYNGDMLAEARRKKAELRCSLKDLRNTQHKLPRTYMEFRHNYAPAYVSGTSD